MSFQFLVIPDGASDLDKKLETVWSSARRSGSLGPDPISKLRDHARGFIPDAWRDVQGLRLIDLGTGVGVPGVLLALELPESRWLLVDANQRCCDLAFAAVTAAGLAPRVEVSHVRAENLARRQESRETFSGAVARRFGPAPELAECGLPLLRSGGLLVLSVSPATERQWRAADLLDLTGCAIQSSWQVESNRYMAITRINPAPENLPRSGPARRRRPLF